MDPLDKPRAAAFLSIKTQFDNLGDALINRELCLLASAQMQTFVDFSRAPVEFERAMNVGGQPNITILRSHGYARLLLKMIGMRATGRVCYFFLNPGGLGGRKKSLFQTGSAALYNVVLWALVVVGVRICHVGISFDPMDRMQRFNAAWRRKLLHSFMVRDLKSARYVQDAGMRADGILPDLSFNLYRTRPELSGGRRSIAFSFRFDGKAGDDQIAGAVESVMRNFGNAYEYLFVVQVARDEIGMRELEASCSHQGRTSLIVCYDDLDKLSLVYASCVAIYSNRLHALLLAAHSGSSPYALISRNSQPKIEGMFADLGLEDRLIFISDESAAIPDIQPLDLGPFEVESVKLASYFGKLAEQD